MGSRSQSVSSMPKWALLTAQKLLASGENLVSPGSAGDKLTYPIAPMDPALEAQLAPFTSTQQAGISALQGTALPSLGLALGGANELQKTMAGGYMNPGSNPYQDAWFNAMVDPVVKNYSSAIGPGNIVAAQQGGVAGGSADRQNQAVAQYGLSQNLTDMANQFYGQGYQTERGIMANAPSQVGALQAALGAPGQQLLGAGTLEQGQQQAGMDIGTQNAQLRQQYPYAQQSYLTNLLGNVTGAGGVTSAGTSK